jgi:hypothetical protein
MFAFIEKPSERYLNASSVLLRERASRAELSIELSVLVAGWNFEEGELAKRRDMKKGGDIIVESWYFTVHNSGVLTDQPSSPSTIA